ncbi:hypothetical protein USDA257_c24260 [Sinorhizobium fredii USDA 257]|uniref:Uncharacterized protein n=1 Tax=Sinorhizobium fredii (strain USDA 257) TaxID=1185652 RepID=I3X546_SINF2|nr:hypothetical protein USDA257_c24260 [Sinorhizobium fredii USDA 257]
MPPGGEFKLIVQRQNPNGRANRSRVALSIDSSLIAVLPSLSP